MPEGAQDSSPYPEQKLLRAEGAGNKTNANSIAGKEKLPTIQVPPINLPKGGGALKSIDEKFSVNAANGTAAFTLPLPVSFGRGLSPAVELSYNSGSGNGVFGLGWSLSTPSIRRKTEKELPQYIDAIDSDTFILAGQEDLVPEFKTDNAGNFLKDGLGNYILNEWDVTFSAIDYRVRRYRSRIEGAFSRIERWTEKATGLIHWRVISKDNVTSLYGKNAAARHADPHDLKKVFEWFLECMYDDKGNCMVYEYKPEDGAGLNASQVHNKNRVNGNALFTQTYLKRIRSGNKTPYTQQGSVFPAGDQFLFETLFDYGEHDAVNIPYPEIKAWNFRTDAFSDYRSGFEIRTCRLCKRVLSFHRFNELPGGSALVKSLTFTYDDNGTNGFTFLKEAVLTGYTKHDDGSYTQQSFPPFSFTYQKVEWNTDVQTIDEANILNTPFGIDEANYQLVDLYSEGLPGILVEQSAAWFYKSNLGAGHFSPPKLVIPKPSFNGLKTGLQLVELEANGVKQLVNWQTEPKGFFELSDENEWQTFVPFAAKPTISLRGAKTRLLDLNGDGLADLLVTEQDVFTWYPSQGKKGYAAAINTVKAFTEEKGPAIVFDDGSESIFLADMSGDGLSDIVRIRNGEVCYWPNLGYGKFGAKVTMDGAPVFDNEDLFHPSLIKLVDVDGSGTTDIIYTGGNQLRIWLNQQGNSFLSPKRIDFFPHTNNLTKISVADLLGTGLSCIIWSSALPKDQQAPLRYIDLLNSKKPHILTGYKNNWGKEVAIAYTPSTQFYVADKQAGTPWITRLPFPVQCVSKVTTYDRIRKIRLASEYTYHHGYYDHLEREFRGFGRVDQKDTEDMAHFIAQGMNTVVEKDLHQPPVLIKSWFHTGAFTDRKKVLGQLAHEYFQNAFVPENVLPEPELPDGLTTDEYREALRACKGILLRKEVFALDGTADEPLPYTAEQHSHLLTVVQPVGSHKHGVFYTHESETITYHYERNPADPRTEHSFVLAIDKYGNELQRALVVYPRKVNPLPAAEQVQLHITFTENTFTNDIQLPLDYRLPLSHSVKTYEVTGVSPLGNYFLWKEIRTACVAAAVIDYEVLPNGTLQKRIIELLRTQYRGDDTTTVLPFGVLQSKGLVHQTFTAAFNNALLNSIFGTKISLASLTPLLTNPAKGGYVFADNYYWIPSLTARYDAAHFYLATRYTDPFGNDTEVTYDSNYFLFVQQVTDALNNTVQVDRFNYRVVQPYVLKDANDNLAAVRFNELGLVVSTFAIGKKGTDKGDEFDDSKTELKNAVDFPGAELEYHLAEWFVQSTAMGFDITNYKPKPAFVKTRTRETHYHAHPMHLTQWQEAYTYSDGNAKVIVTKNQAEPGKALQVQNDGTVVEVDTTPNVRWVGNGRTILNNKGNAVKQYEPYFSTLPTFDDEKEMVELGVTPIIHYDPLSRVIQTDYPNKTFSKVTLTPWQQKNFDANDTVRDSQWYADRGSPNPLGAEPANPDQRAAWLAAKHHNTPTIAHVDTLGRIFRTIADTATETIATTTVFDSKGNVLQVIDGLSRTVMTYVYDLSNSQLKQSSLDAGNRWTILDVAGKPLLNWDDRNHQFSYAYDALHRPISFLVEESGVTTLLTKTEYGESLPVAASKANNLRTRVYKQYDPSGITTNLQYDFKGNNTSGTKQFAQDYKNKIDWTTIGAVVLETGIFESSTEYDALNRPIKIRTPHRAASPVSELVPGYNEAALLETMDGFIRGSATPTPFITNIDYNAKGQREAIFYGNGTKTAQTFEKETFRLLRILTTRNNGADILQDIQYTYDPVGNPTQVKDNAQPDVFFDGELAKALNTYEYDALYRLLKATGRKHAGQTDISHSGVGSPPNFRNHPFIPSNTINPNDAQAFRTYTENYQYDKAGNMLQQQHQAKSSNWTRTFSYVNGNNQLTGTAVGGFSTSYTYDAHGNLQQMEHLQQLIWDVQDQLKEANLGGGGRAYYVYDGTGQRVRKVIERLNGTRQERFYLGPIELYREYSNGGATVLERETLQVMDDKKRLALVDSPVIKPVSSLETQLIRYQYSNHLQSALLELDEAAQVITYEEYFPYGTTSFSTIDASREVPAKRYRYTGKERDEETGLNYHGARYYALWLCRWISADPTGIKDGLNLYRYVNDNPIKLMDAKGTDGDDPNNPKIDLGPPPVYESTGDQAKKDVGEVAKKTLDVVTDSPEFKKLTDPLKDKFLGPIKANLPPFIGAGIFLGVPLITSLIIIDKKVEFPIAGEQRTRDLGFKAISGIGGAALKELTDDKVGFEIKNEEEKKYEFKVDIKPSKDLSFSGGATFADKYKVEFGVKKEFTLDPKLVAPGTISFGYKTAISEDKKPSFTFDVSTQLLPAPGVDIRIGGSLFINKEADKPGLTFPDKDSKAPVIPFAPSFSGTGFQLGVTAAF